jgi:excisionase family DNA binding protein
MQTDNKDFITTAELAAYLGVSLSYVYKLSFYNTLPKYCPGKKLVWFKRTEVDEWLNRFRIASEDELAAEAELAAYKNRRVAR